MTTSTTRALSSLGTTVVVDLDNLITATAPALVSVPAPRRPRTPDARPEVDVAAVWEGLQLDTIDHTIVYPCPGGTTVRLTVAETAMALAYTPARYTELNTMLNRDLPDVAAMVVASVTEHGVATIRAAAAQAHVVLRDALHGPDGWTTEHDLDLAVMWGGGSRTQQVCHGAGHRLNAFLSWRFWPCDADTPRPGALVPGAL